MDDFLRSIIPNVSAQTADTIAQPTFGPINVGGGGNTTGASILLTSDKTAALVGETVTVQVAIKTNNIPITEYRIAIDFDPTLLRVIDEDSATPGTQMRMLDTAFTITNPEQNNIVTNVGRARLIATAPQNTAQAVNTSVLEIRFQVQAVGNPRITIVQGTTGSQLIRQAGVGLTFTSNEISIQASANTGTPPVTDGSTPVTNGTPNPTTGTTPVTTTNPGNTTGTIIPDTALSPGFISILTLVIAMLSVLMGLSLRSTNRKKRDL